MNFLVQEGKKKVKLRIQLVFFFLAAVISGATNSEKKSETFSDRHAISVNSK